jgi:SNF2 family DNA or RNA helicase
VAFAELGWTPALHEQAEDRVHRIGQVSGRVTAWYLIAPDTFDEAMMRLLRRKRKVIAQATQGE